MRLGWLFSRSGLVGFFGERILTSIPADFRAQNTIRTGSPVCCAYTGPRRGTTLAATKPRDPWPLGRGLAAHNELLGWGPGRPARYRRHIAILRSGFQPLGLPDLGSDCKSWSRPSNHPQKPSDVNGLLSLSNPLPLFPSPFPTPLLPRATQCERKVPVLVTRCILRGFVFFSNDCELYVILSISQITPVNISV